MTNLISILKSRDITLSTKVCLVKVMVFPVVMYGCESWTIKKADHWRIDAFELWCWRRLLRVPWTAKSPFRRKSVLNIHWKEWCWSWNLATWYEELTHLKRPWCWERLKAGEGDDRGWDSWMASPTQWTWVWVSSRSWWWTGRPGVLQSMGLQGVGHDWVTELNWTNILFSLAEILSPLFTAWKTNKQSPNSYLPLKIQLKCHHKRLFYLYTCRSSQLRKTGQRNESSVSHLLVDVTVCQELLRFLSASFVFPSKQEWESVPRHPFPQDEQVP